MTKSVECDVLVVGSGAGGLAAAVSAAAHGLKVVVAEKDSWVGGTTAFSGGFMWVPNNPVSRRDGIEDSLEEARTYLRHEAGNHFNADTADAFLREGPEAVSFFETRTALTFEPASAFSDYHPTAPGGRSGGRSFKAEAFRGEKLGSELKRLRPPLPELTFVGLMIGSGPELKHFFNVTRSLKSAAYVAGRLASHAKDLLRHGRGMLLTNGNALAARLFRSALDLKVDVWTDAPATRLLVEDGAVRGAIVSAKDGPVEVRTRCGVVLAAGGFPQDKARRRAMFAHDLDNTGHVSPAPVGNTGDGLRLGEEAGASVEDRFPNAAAWVPVSRVPRRGGGFGVFPHFIDRAKPGPHRRPCRTGRRFVNEADSYHDFVQALFKAGESGRAPHAHLVVDAPFLKRFGLGYVKPLPGGRSGRTSGRATSRRAARSPSSPARPASTRRGSRTRLRPGTATSRNSARTGPSARARRPTTASTAIRTSSRTPASPRSRRGPSTRWRSWSAISAPLRGCGRMAVPACWTGRGGRFPASMRSATIWRASWAATTRAAASRSGPP